MTGPITKAVEQRDTQPSPRKVLADLLERNRNALRLSLPKAMDEDRFARLLLTAANTNPALFDCDPRSFLAAGVACAQLGLEPNDARGQAYLIPFKDKRRGRVVQLIIGYRGLMDLARRSGMVSTINSFPVFAGDVFHYELGLNPTLSHVPGDHDEPPEDMTHVYAVAKVKGDPQFVVMTRRQVERVRASSQGADSQYSPWRTHFVEMAQKTAIRRLCKFLPQSVELSTAIERDEARPLQLTDLGHVEHEADHDDAIDVGDVGDGLEPPEPEPEP